MVVAVAVFMLAMGVAIAAVWTRDIVAGMQVDLSAGFFRARDDAAGTLFWPHWIAEYGTAAALVAGAIGLLLGALWGEPVSFAALGALLYTSANSLGWAWARPERRPYAIPMLVGVVGGAGALAVLLAA